MRSFRTFPAIFIWVVSSLVLAVGGDEPRECRDVSIDCDDGDPCTEDVCDPITGLCENIVIDCDDGDPCADDSCDPITGLCENVRIPECDTDGDGIPVMSMMIVPTRI